MNTVTRIVVLFVVLSTLPQNSASAGFFDWLASRETDSVILKSFDGDILSESNNHIWDLINNEIEKGKNKAKFQVIRTHVVRATGYSSTPDQTDSTPFVTASGTYVRDGVIAANIYVNGRRLPFGTLVRIPDIYGDKIFVVEDRMNIRYKNNIDIWFSERSSALTFGSKKVTIEIVEES